MIKVTTNAKKLAQQIRKFAPKSKDSYCVEIAGTNVYVYSLSKVTYYLQLKNVVEEGSHLFVVNLVDFLANLNQSDENGDVWIDTSKAITVETSVSTMIAPLVHEEIGRFTINVKQFIDLYSELASQYAEFKKNECCRKSAKTLTLDGVAVVFRSDKFILKSMYCYPNFNNEMPPVVSGRVSSSNYQEKIGAHYKNLYRAIVSLNLSDDVTIKIVIVKTDNGNSFEMFLVETENGKCASMTCVC